MSVRGSSQLFGVMVATGLVGGIAFARALATGSTVAWCLTTACIVIALCGLLLAVLYVRFVKSPAGGVLARTYFANRPKELDILLSATDPRERAFAAAELVRMAGEPNWPYREDAIAVLRNVVDAENPEPMVLASSLGALSEFGAKATAQVMLAIARDKKRPPYVRMAAILAAAKTATCTTQLMEIASDENHGTDIRFTALIGLKCALALMTVEEQEQTRLWLSEFAARKHRDQVLTRFAQCVALGQNPDPIYSTQATDGNASEGLRVASFAGLLQEWPLKADFPLQELRKVGHGVTDAVACLLWGSQPANVQEVLNRVARTV